MTAYTNSLINAIDSLDREIKYLSLLPDKDLTALITRLELLLNRVEYENTRRLLTQARQ